MIRKRMTLTLICLVAVQLILLVAMSFLVRENSHLKQVIKDMASTASKLPENSLFPSSKINVTNVTLDSKPRSEGTVINTNPRQFLPSEVTILLLKRSDQTSSFETKLEKIKRMFSTSPVKWDGQQSSSMGESLNRTIKEIKTEYFVILEADASLSDKTNEGITTLWDALERYPEIDFIGGSYLSGDKFHVICQRYRLCKWTYSESYEYKRSLDNIMICDGTSASFMGRTKSMAKIQGGFDAGISDLLVMKDFFVRAKAANVVVATRPSFILMHVGFQSLYDMWQSRDISKELISFAIKHKVFIFKDQEENIIDLCSSTSPLSGKDVCIERNAHKHMLNNGHWAYQGLYTYPFVLSYLKITLREVINFLEQHNVCYVLVGGVSLGAVKMHSILPWEAGDIDIQVYNTSVPQLLSLFRPWADEKGYVLREHTGSGSVQVFCTPKGIGDVSGGLATIFPKPATPPKYVRIKTNGIWVRYERDLFEAILKKYGQGYLQHKLYHSETIVQCKIKGHNACLPDFQSISNGKGGTYQEYFCVS